MSHNTRHPTPPRRMFTDGRDERIEARQYLASPEPPTNFGSLEWAVEIARNLPLTLPEPTPEEWRQIAEDDRRAFRVPDGDDEERDPRDRYTI